MSIPDLDPKALQRLMKMGGKKQVDSETQLIKADGAMRLKEWAAAGDLREAQSAARALKASAAKLGLAALEDLCDQVLEAQAWPIDASLVETAKGALQRGLRALDNERSLL
ncbi:MAG TPA: hypothetical protein VK842_02755 [bacterium]|jgi:hypothetical protein|nr:hypothetical protein [bacterium]